VRSNEAERRVEMGRLNRALYSFPPPEDARVKQTNSKKQKKLSPSASQRVSSRHCGSGTMPSPLTSTTRPHAPSRYAIQPIECFSIVRQSSARKEAPAAGDFGGGKVFFEIGKCFAAPFRATVCDASVSGGVCIPYCTPLKSLHPVI